MDKDTTSFATRNSQVGLINLSRSKLILLADLLLLVLIVMWFSSNAVARGATGKLVGHEMMLIRRSPALQAPRGMLMS